MSRGKRSLVYRINSAQNSRRMWWWRNVRGYVRMSFCIPLLAGIQWAPPPTNSLFLSIKHTNSFLFRFAPTASVYFHFAPISINQKNNICSITSFVVLCIEFSKVRWVKNEPNISNRSLKRGWIMVLNVIHLWSPIHVQSIRHIILAFERELLVQIKLQRGKKSIQIQCFECVKISSETMESETFDKIIP